MVGYRNKFCNKWLNARPSTRLICVISVIWIEFPRIKSVCWTGRSMVVYQWQISCNFKSELSSEQLNFSIEPILLKTNFKKPKILRRNIISHSKFYKINFTTSLFIKQKMWKIWQFSTKSDHKQILPEEKICTTQFFASSRLQIWGFL